MKLDTAMEDQTRVLRTVALAAAIAFGLDSVLGVIAGPFSPSDIAARLAAYVFLLPIYLAVGWWLGTRAWPKGGSALTRSIIRRRIASKKLIFICDRPDAPRSLPRRIWEVTGFAAGISIFGYAVERLLLPPPIVTFLLLTLLPLVTLWGAFAIVPYWQLSRLGLRTVDPLRWTIIPIGRRYAERAKLSNGVLVLLGAGALFNVLFRAGLSNTEALANVLTVSVRTVVSIMVIAAAAVAYYNRGEFGHAHKLELESIEMGVRDGRGMSDGDFLPRLPPPRTRSSG